MDVPTTSSRSERFCHSDQTPSRQAPHSDLWLYFSCYDESHTISQSIESVEGSFWHGILHRQEPDPGNAAYWFRRVGSHPVFPELQEAAAELNVAGLFPLGKTWDPF